MPTSKQLNQWIAETGSWQTFIDYRLPVDQMANYTFIKFYENFYISLMSNAFELLKSKNFNEDELLSIAKGLEIFSLINKRENFKGVNHSNNLLYAAGLYYLSNYSASAWILSQVYPKDYYQNEIDEFLIGFLKRELDNSNQLCKLLNSYLITGRIVWLNLLRVHIIRSKRREFENDVYLYFSYSLAELLVNKFAKDNIWKDLLEQNKNYDHWEPFVRYNTKKKVSIWSFFPSQKEALKRGILSESTCSLQMPTSSGKTSICELIIYDTFRRNSNCKILYLAPYRALASELKQSLSICLNQYKITSKTIYGGNLPTYEERTLVTDVNLLISTPEKFMALEDIFPGISEEYSTIICDEGHLLDDESRGLSYELLLTRLKGNSKIPNRFIFISAIIPNISIINTWLGGSNYSLITSSYRPTEINYALLKPSGSQNYYLDVNPYQKQPYNYQLYKYLTGDELREIKSKKGISVAAALKAAQAGTVALFSAQKGGSSGVEALAKEAINQLINIGAFKLEQYSKHEQLTNLKEYFTVVFGPKYLLTECSRYGILYHHGDFPQNIREIMEDSIRKGIIRFVICTNTLAEGVNLPIKTLVIHSARRYNPNYLGYYEPLKIRVLKNLVGRAGRAGKEIKGLVIFTDSKDFSLVKSLLREDKLEPVNGQLYNIVKSITSYLERKRLKVTNKILDELSDELEELVDSIDISLIDLLSEEIGLDNLQELVKQHLTQTLSYFQSTEKEKNTLTNLFNYRAEKLKPIIRSNQFKILKKSGTSLRLYEDILAQVNLQGDIWNTPFNILDETWLDYILGQGVFKLEWFKAKLEAFNKKNNCSISTSEIKNAIKLWMSGAWYSKLSDELNLDVNLVIRIINSFIGHYVQNIISVIIRLKEITNEDYSMPIQIMNWPNYLQYGINNQVQLDLIELGLIDRVAIIKLSDYLKEIKFNYKNYREFKLYLSDNHSTILRSLKNNIPTISFDCLKKFLNQLTYKLIL